MIFINFSSKNYYSLKRFTTFFMKFCKKLHLNAIILQKNAPKPKRVKKFTILKSPHVNKTAQEQFEFRLYSRQLIILSPQIFKVLVFFKRFQAALFSDIRFQIKLSFNSSRDFTIDLDNFHTKPSLDLKSSKLTCLNRYICLFDVYGESLIN